MTEAAIPALESLTTTSQEGRLPRCSMSDTVGTQAVVMPIPDKLDMRRYAPDSTKFGDAKPSVFEELKVGDQARALGNKSADGTRFTPERLVSGSFRMVAGTVTAVDAATGEVQIKDLQTRQSLTVVIKPDSVIRKFPDMAALPRKLPQEQVRKELERRERRHRKQVRPRHRRPAKVQNQVRGAHHPDQPQHPRLPAFKTCLIACRLSLRRSSKPATSSSFPALKAQT